MFEAIPNELRILVPVGHDERFLSLFAPELSSNFDSCQSQKLNLWRSVGCSDYRPNSRSGLDWHNVCRLTRLDRC